MKKTAAPVSSFRSLYHSCNAFLKRLESGTATSADISDGVELIRHLVLLEERRGKTMRLIIRGLGRLGVFVKNYESGETYPNTLWRAFGYGEKEMQGDRWIHYVHPDDQARVVADHEQQFNGNQDVTQSAHRVRDRFGDWRWILTKTLVLSRGRRGTPSWLIGADFDITLRVQAEERARLARARSEQKAREAESLLATATVISSALEWEQAVQSVLDQAARVVPNDVTLVALIAEGAVRILGGRRADGKPVESDSNARRTRGKNPYSWIAEERRPLSINDISAVYPEAAVVDGIPVRAWLGVPLIASDRLMGAVVFARSGAGHYLSDHIRLAAAFGEHVAVVLRNAWEFREIRLQATTDVLTEALTRRAFLEEGRNELARCRAKGQPLSLLMLDIDHFKQVNDEFGHNAGDQVLRDCARVWQRELRERDILGRVGGEEFAVCLPGADRDVATRIAERLRGRTSDVAVTDGSRTVTASIGVATSLPRAGELRLEELINLADQNLYRAKNEGRNRVVAELPNMQSPNTESPVSAGTNPETPHSAFSIGSTPGAAFSE